MNSAFAIGFSYIVIVLCAIGMAAGVSFLCLRLKQWSSTQGLSTIEANDSAHAYGSTIISIGLGLVAVALWTGNQSCQQAQVTMADSLAKTYRACDVLPAQSKQRIAQLFIQFVEESRSLDQSVSGIGPTNRFWQPLHAARAEAAKAASSLPDVWQIFVRSQFDRLMETRHLWAFSFVYQLQPLLWVVFVLAALFLLLTMITDRQVQGMQPWTDLMSVALPISLLLAACWMLSDPFEGVCKVDTTPLLNLAPLLEENTL